MQYLDVLKENAWSTPDDYLGHNPEGDYVIYCRHRDSTILDDVNYGIICKELGAVDDDYTAPVYTFRASHWAVGWVEYVIVRKDAPEETLETASGFICSLADYPSLDDEAYSSEQYHAVQDYWASQSVRERVYWCAEAGESIFSARRDYPSEKVLEHLEQSEMFY